jgi:4-hydroxy-tetrahydrodipicolinate synthase
MSIDRVRAAIAGVSAIHVTPYRPDGEVDERALAGIVAPMNAAGIHNIVSCGNTGEFFSLTLDEVARIQAAAFAAIDGRSLRTAAVGRSLRDAIATGKQAVAAGAQALMIHHPMDPFASPVAQADYFIAVAEASTVPVMAYLRMDTIPLRDVARIAGHGNVAGIKFATPNLVYFADCVRATANTQCRWVCGLAEGWAPAFYGAGARGFTSGFVNVDPEYSLSVFRALEGNDFVAARALVDRIAPFEKMRTLHNNGANVTVVKEALMLKGVDTGPVRLPGLPRLADADRAELARILKQLGYTLK